MNTLEIINHFYHGVPLLQQRLLKHSCQVRDKAFELLDRTELDLDRDLVADGAMLHDIGIIFCDAPAIDCNGDKHYISHGIIGGAMLRQYGTEHGVDLEKFARICERHTGSGLTADEIRKQNLPLPEQNYLPETPEEMLICLADKFFSKSGNMQEKPLEKVINSIKKFGDIPLNRLEMMCRYFSVLK